MAIILVILYAFFFILVGAQGNATTFLTMVQAEKTFLYWAVVLLVIAALLQVQGAGQNFARAFAALIVVGFLLSNNNGLTIIRNAQAILPALGGNAATATSAGATGAAGGLT
jgi:hypothetical protein